MEKIYHRLGGSLESGSNVSHHENHITESGELASVSQE